MTNNHLPIGGFFFLCWAFMIAFDYFFSWFSFPDLLLTAIIYWFIMRPDLEIWIWALPVSLLMDIAGITPFGFHALFYAIAALLALPLIHFWRFSPPAVSVLILIIAAIFLQAIRCLLHFFISGIPAPEGWLWVGFWQAATLLPVRWIADKVTIKWAI